MSFPIAAGCGRAPEATAGTVAVPSPDRPTAPSYFVDQAEAAGIAFRHSTGGTGKRWFVETTGSGCALFDYDNDGWLDVLLLDAGPLPGTPERARADAERAPRNRLYRNLALGSGRSGLGEGDEGARGREGEGARYARSPVRRSTEHRAPSTAFQDVTAGSGLETTGYAQGVAVGDYDNDGYPDLYITAYGRNTLFRNEGGTGRFTDVTRQAGVEDTAAGPRWSLSAAFGDFDRDGDLDLFVCHYVQWTPATDRPCYDARGNPSFCHPQVYDGDTMTLYRNNGDGTFTDVTRAAGLDGLVGRGMGAVWLDDDGDGWPDLYVANDLMPNFLLRNQRDGSFVDVGLAAGVAVSDSGTLLSGMGVAAGDYDGDLREDLFVTNFSKQGNSLYRNEGGGSFSNRTFASGVGTISLNWLGFGCAFLDEDLDGRLDVLIANGHVMDNVALTEREITFAQRKSLYRNRGDGTFEDVAAGAGDLDIPRVSRGLAIGDVDNDGALDALVNNQNDAPQLLMSTTRQRHPERRWIALLLRGTQSNRDGFNARVTVQAGGQAQVREARSAFSYGSASDPRLHFGLGSAANVDTVTVRWPSGRTDVFHGLAAGRSYLVTEGKGIRPL